MEYNNSVRTLVMGDTHGALRAFDQCLGRSGYNPKIDQLIMLADYVDGWPEVYQLVNRLIDLQEQCQERGWIEPIYLRGNHDQWLQEYLTTGIVDPNWVRNGGQSTLDSYRNQFVDKHEKFFKYLHNYYVDEENRAYVHAGYLNIKGLGHDAEDVYYWDRSLFNNTFTMLRKPQRLNAHKEVYIGHTATTFNNTDKPIIKHNLFNIDTGAGWYGKLTIMDVDTKEYWQSDNSQDLYPGVRPRD